MKNPSVYAKAFTAAATALGTGVVTAASDGVITLTEWVVIVSGVLAAAAATYVVPNRDPEGEHQEQSVQPPEPIPGTTLAGRYAGDTKADAAYHPQHARPLTPEESDAIRDSISHQLGRQWRPEPRDED